VITPSNRPMLWCQFATVALLALPFAPSVEAQLDDRGGNCIIETTECLAARTPSGRMFVPPGMPGLVCGMGLSPDYSQKAQEKRPLVCENGFRQSKNAHKQGPFHARFYSTDCFVQQRI